MLPFSRDAFFAVFAAYNTAVWPAQLLLYGLAAALVVLVVRDRPRARMAVNQGIGAGLGGPLVGHKRRQLKVHLGAALDL